MPFRASSLVYDICSDMPFLPFSIASCAKINLGLRILRRRSDGYHDIESIFVAIDLSDVLKVEPADTLSVDCRPEVTLEPDQNIVFRAASLYARCFPNDECGAKITVSKRIPTGAGLGGGSGDAAATLLAMAHINGRLGDPQTIALLEPLAARCGSDVPFFLHAGLALVTGRGEHVTPINATFPWTVLVVCPGIHVNTATAYSTLGITGEYPSPRLREHLLQAIASKRLDPFVFANDFERSVYPQHPTLKEIKDRISRSGASYVSMSGSGSSVFGLYEDATNAAAAAAELADLEPYICAPVTASFRPI
jgi:4-diphosphocytidyl-2-C-methyl-D-erythritol kinase